MIHTRPTPVRGLALPDEPHEDDFARRCREPAELWMLARRRWRPAPSSVRLPRVVAT